jgi:hypothetical protein
MYACPVTYHHQSTTVKNSQFSFTSFCNRIAAKVTDDYNDFAGTLKSILEDRQIRIVPNRGFSSIAFSHDNIERLKDFQYEGKSIHIVYFGDLDPSGEIIDEVIYKKLRL